MVRLSRTISHALRHEPWLYELEPDGEGWVPLEALLQGLRRERAAWAGLTEDHVQEVLDSAEKRRFELAEGRIRALYGHSLPGRLQRQPAAPPALLFHGTAPESLARIEAEGLRPMARQFVHLSTDAETASAVGRRKASAPVLLVVAAEEAHAAGVPFYRGNEQVWLADHVPARYLTRRPG